jgi:hypothetical protein
VDEDDVVRAKANWVNLENCLRRELLLDVDFLNGLGLANEFDGGSGARNSSFSSLPSVVVFCFRD